MRPSTRVGGLLGVLAGLAAGAAPCAPARAEPSNDACGADPAAWTIPGSGGAVSGTLEGATRDALGTSCPLNQSGVDVYHYFVPASTGLHLLQTCGSPVDTVLSVHGPPCPASTATQLAGACSDDDCGPQSRVRVWLAAGDAYIIRVGAYRDTSVLGPYTLSVSYLPGPVNDDCGAGLPALRLGEPATGSTANAVTNAAIAPASQCGGYAGSGGGNDVFYAFRTAWPGTYDFSTCGSSFDTVLSVHSACPAQATSRLIACNDDAPGCTRATVSRLVLDLPGATDYVVRVAGFGTTTFATGSYVLTVTSDPPPAGACCTGVGVCVFSPAAECQGPGYLGDGSACQPGSCGTPALGVCCRGATCRTTLTGDCTGPRTVWTAAVGCNAPDNRVSPCCYADFNKVEGVELLDIFAFLEAWFGGSPDADLAGNGSGTPDILSIFGFLEAWFAGC